MGNFTFRFSRIWGSVCEPRKGEPGASGVALCYLRLSGSENETQRLLKMKVKFPILPTIVQVGEKAAERENTLDPSLETKLRVEVEG